MANSSCSSSRRGYQARGTRPPRLLGRRLRDASGTLCRCRSVRLRECRPRVCAISGPTNNPQAAATTYNADVLARRGPPAHVPIPNSFSSTVIGVYIWSGSILANQIPILQQCLALDRERIGVVPFGVDTEYYDAATMREPGGGSGLIAVGGDRRRDLLDAGGSGSDRRCAAHPGLLSPKYCRARSPASHKGSFRHLHDEYRRLLHSRISL